MDEDVGVEGAGHSVQGAEVVDVDGRAWLEAEETNVYMYHYRHQASMGRFHLYFVFTYVQCLLMFSGNLDSNDNLLRVLYEKFVMFIDAHRRR